MTSKEKARYEELSAKDCLIDDEDVIDYYRLRCEMLEQENQELKNEIQDLKDNETIVASYGVDLWNENHKLKKAIELLKDLLNLSLCIDEYEPNSDRVPLLCTKNNDYILNDEKYDLLKEVLG